MHSRLFDSRPNTINFMAFRLALGLFLLMFLSSCSEKKMTEQWCEAMMEKPNQEWTNEKDIELFARDCLSVEG